MHEHVQGVEDAGANKQLKHWLNVLFRLLKLT